MYYFTYDPWIGKLLYLEDFFVMSDYRGKLELAGEGLKGNHTISPYNDLWNCLVLGFGIGSEILKNLSQVCPSFGFLNLWQLLDDFSLEAKSSLGKQIKCHRICVSLPS